MHYRICVGIFIHIIKNGTLKEYLRDEKRLTSLSGRKGCKQAHSLEGKNGRNISKY